MTYEVQCDPAALQRITHIFSSPPPLSEKVFDFGGETRFVLSYAVAVVAFHRLTKV